MRPDRDPELAFSRPTCTGKVLVEVWKVGEGWRVVDCFGKSRSAGFGRHFGFLAVFFALFSRVFGSLDSEKCFVGLLYPVSTRPLGRVGGEERARYRRLLGRAFCGQRGLQHVSPVFREFFPNFFWKTSGGRGAPPSAVSARAEKKAHLRAHQRTAHLGQHYRTTRRYFGPTYSATFGTRHVLRFVSKFCVEAWGPSLQRWTSSTS